ncbi:hypothetical protein EMPG_14876 [Blastomyces silverae]|uniref:Uncharacterized protein n=1 Tax=Blastomyces silverae TaxID=2060906 RepID=A0A0H1BF04_9EURO|nr:hypothetical protein EMPG_14876 [Blastomyces silverae]
MDIVNDDGSDIEWSHMEDIDEEMPDVTSPNSSGNHDPYSMDKNIISDDDSLMTDAVDGPNAQDGSGHSVEGGLSAPTLASSHVPLPTSSPMQVQPTIPTPTGRTSSPEFVSTSHGNSVYSCYEMASISPTLSRPRLHRSPPLRTSAPKHGVSKNSFDGRFAGHDKGLNAQRLTTAGSNLDHPTFPLSLYNYPFPPDQCDARKCPRVHSRSPVSEPPST